MAASIVVAGIGNIFQGDDAFGVHVVRQLMTVPLPANVCVMDIGIRSIDLAFALLNPYDLTILVDATSHGCEPGTLYTIEIDPEDIPDEGGQDSVVNSHALDPVRVLSLAKSMGAQFRKILLVGCEPLIVDRDDSGHIGLTDVVEAAVVQAIETIRQIVEEFERASEVYALKEEVMHEFR